jgi:hypothetical protein
MGKQNVLYKINLKDRGFRSDQEVIFRMQTHAPLSPNQRHLLANRTGQILLALGSLLADPSVSDNPASARTGRSLVSLGHKLINAGSCCNDN